MGFWNWHCEFLGFRGEFRCSVSGTSFGSCPGVFEASFKGCDTSRSLGLGFRRLESRGLRFSFREFGVQYAEGWSRGPLSHLRSGIGLGIRL